LSHNLFGAVEDFQATDEAFFRSAQDGHSGASVAANLVA
jgi:hypothetical protein